MSEMNEIMKSETGIQTNGFGETSLAQSGGTLSEVLAARAQAEVNACYIMAERHPRNWDQVRTDMLDAVKRPGFAGLNSRQSLGGEAWYAIKIGGNRPTTIQGFSIRFAEEAIRAMGNISVDTTVIFEGETQRMVEVRVIDFEKNVPIKTTIVIDKTVERSYLKDYEVAIGERTNSNGKKVFIRMATDDELLKKQNSAVSKALRNNVLRMLPGDIQAACKDQILNIRQGEVVEDPKAYQRKIVDSFTEIGVQPQALVDWLGHDLTACSPSQMADLKDLYRDIRDGATTWADVLATKAERDKPAQSAAEVLTDQLKEDNEKTVNQPGPMNFLTDAIDERFKKEDGKKWLKAQCKAKGYNHAKLENSQISLLIDELNSEGEK